MQDEKWIKVDIRPGDIHWSPIAHVIKMSSMQYETKNGEPTSIKINVTKPKNVFYKVVANFIDNEWSTFDIFKKI